MIRGKKAMMFTLISALLVAVIIYQYTIVTTSSHGQKNFVTASRINSMNDFIESVEQDMVRSLMIASYRAIISMQQYIANNGVFISDIQTDFSELIINGTINSSMVELMANSSINDWAIRINEEAAKINININFIPIGVVVKHTDPWNIIVILNMTFNVTDDNNLASWHFNDSVQKEISILNFEDPLYTINSQDKVTNIIIRANNSNFVNTINNDTAVLYNHLNNSFYAESSYAPSFLMRFSGNLSNSTFGIESFVNRQEFYVQGIGINDSSLIDYQYFNSTYDNSDDYCNFEAYGMPSWFRIHKDRRDDYNLSGMGSPC